MKITSMNYLKICTSLAFALMGSVASASVQLDGFGSMYFSQAAGDVLPAGVSNHRPDFSYGSMLGLNMYSKLDDQLSVKGQIIGYGEAPRGEANERSYLVAFQWGFLNWDINPATTFQMGRLLYPSWISSEYYNVGYLLPYRAIPGAVFLLAPFKSFDGASLGHTISTDMGKIILSAFGGTPVYDGAIPGGSLNLSNFWGVSAAMEGDGWQLKATYSNNENNIVIVTPPAPPTVDLSAISEVITLGIKLDKANVVFWADAIMTKAKSGATEIAPGITYNDESSGGYALIGYRMGKFMPRYTYSMATSELNILGVTGEQKAITQIIGLNYDFNPQAIIKVEYEMRKIDEGAVGSFAYDRNGTGDDGSSIYAGLDFTF